MKKFISTVLLGCATLTMVAQQSYTDEGTETGTEQEETKVSTKLTSLKVFNGRFFTFKTDQFNYIFKVSTPIHEYKEGCISYVAETPELVNVTTHFNPATRIAEIKVTAKSDASQSTTYRIKFNREFYQLEDPSFEKYTEGDEPLYGWYSFASATGELNHMRRMSPNPESVEGGANGSKRAVKLTSKAPVPIFPIYANGNLTTGIINMGSSEAADSANHNFTAVDSISNSLSFAGRPDSVCFYAKFKAGAKNSGKCGQANFILHKNGEYKDPEDQSLLSNRIAKAHTLIKESAQWVRYSVPFVYDNLKVAVKYLLASVTTNPVPGESEGDELFFDDVHFIYNNDLADLSYKGAKLDFKREVHHYDLSTVSFFEDSLSYQKSGVMAKASHQFDTKTGLLTITVKGNDENDKFNDNKENCITTYTVQFDLPGTAKLTDLQYKGQSLENFNKDKFEYIIRDKDFEENMFSYTAEDGEFANVETVYDPARRVANVNVTTTKGVAKNTYKVKFDKAYYQFEDPSFEHFASEKEPLYGWNSFASATGTMAGLGAMMSPNPISVEDGANGSQRAVMLYSKYVIMANANGNMTTGIINMGFYIPTDPSNHNFTDTTSLNNQFRFAGRPDSVTFYAKFKAGKLNSAKVGRAQFILHDNCQYKDPEDSTQLAHRIGKASQLITESAKWVKYTVPFNYDKKQTETQYLLASVTTNPIPGESEGDSLYFDEVHFVYDHAISALTYKGAEIEFNENTLKYDLSDFAYEKDSLSYTVKGAGAEVSEEYDAKTAVLTITIKGNDYAVNPNSITVYTLQFNTSTGINAVENEESNVNVYDINGRILRKNVKAATALQNLPSGVYIVNGKKVVK